MGKRHPNPRQIKIHRSYTVEEAASLLDVHKNTVREWIKRGLPTVDDRRPMLILGRDLFEFLQEKKTKSKRPCTASEIYCVKCRAPKIPAEGMVEYQPTTESLGNLFGICPDCESGMNRWTSLAKLKPMLKVLGVTLPEGLQHIVDSVEPSLNSDFRKEAKDHANTLSK